MTKRIMKALRYLFIVNALLMLPMFVMAQFTSYQDYTRDMASSIEIGFRSTSAMQGSGATINFAAQSGVMLCGNNPTDGGVPAGAPCGPRRAKMDDDPWGGSTIGDVDKPQEPGTPIGDGVWVMLLMAAGLMCYRMVRSRGSLAVGKVVTEAQ